MKKNKLFHMLIFLLFVASQLFLDVQRTFAKEGDALWVRSTVTATNYSVFEKSTLDADNNVYAVGYIYRNGELTFGNNVSATGIYATDTNALLVKYNSEGVAQWAKSPIVAPNKSLFNGVATDSSGNVFVSGYIYGNGEYDFGNGVTISGAYASNTNALLIKYNSEGVAQWARSTIAAPNASIFNASRINSSGIYVVGSIRGNGEFNFGNSVTVSGAYASSTNALLIKYDFDGNAQWAKSTVIASNISSYNNIKMDLLGNIYTVGYIYNSGEYNFGNDIIVSGGYTTYNALLVKYNSDGVAQWAKSANTGPNESFTTDLALDSTGNIYVNGYIVGSNEYSFGNGVSVSGANASYNGYIAKYNSNGLAQWARSTIVAPSISNFFGIALDDFGNIYISGYINGSSEYNFGNNVTVSGNYSDGLNNLLLKYDFFGSAQWARVAAIAPASGRYSGGGLSVNTLNDIYISGYIIGVETFDFGSGIIVNGGFAGNKNALLIKYSGVDTTSPEFEDLPGENRPINLDEGQTVSTNPYTIRIKPVDVRGISRADFYVDDHLLCSQSQADTNGVYSCNWNTELYHSLVKVTAFDNDNNFSSITRNVNVLFILPETGMN